MKKTVVLFVLFMLSGVGFSNPLISPPPFYVGKFYFDNNQEWKIQINCMEGNLDSILICSSSSKSICRKCILTSQNNYLITNDCLLNDITINTEGDSISLTYYSKDIFVPYNELIVFGNYRNSTIPKPSKGQSIVEFFIKSQVVPQQIFHCLEDSLGNTLGEIHGHIYNKNNNLIQNDTLAISPFLGYLDSNSIYCDYLAGYIIPDTFIAKSDGSYSTKLNSLKYNLNTIYICRHCSAGYNYTLDTSRMLPLSFTITPDTSFNLDIHISGDYADIIQSITSSNQEIFKIYPNPIYGQNFQYEISTPVQATNCILKLININGEEIRNYNITANKGSLTLPAVSNGTYIIQLIMNRKVYASIKLSVLQQ